MANEEPREPICETGKTYLINPNLIFGQGVDDNISVPIEDLNIYVELSTSKKSRSIIDILPEGTDITSSTDGKTLVSFIDGNDNGKVSTDKDGNVIKGKSLTTSYTELSTVFNQTADTEKFGIASIDVTFNSSYAPLVNIKFIDVRGASLFNTAGPNGPQSEYASFFDLPYPIFSLKIKGYYGKTVKYCLHLTKWNAKFNDKTGNFEITADFIGYTYAMLTDMLLGYMRAIVETPIGKEKFQKAKNEMVNSEELITIQEFLDKIVDVNEAIVKLQSEDVDLVKLGQNKDLKSDIETLENLVQSSIELLTVPDNSQLSIGYALLNSGGLIGVRGASGDTAETIANEADIANFKDAIRGKVGKLNESLAEGTKYNVDDFAGDDAPNIFNNFNYNRIFSGQAYGVPFINQEQLNFRNAWGLTDEFEFAKFQDERINALPPAYRDVDINLYDFKKILDKIGEIKDTLNSDEESIKDAVGEKLKGTFIDVLGFEPSIRNIFRIFTVHAEIFMESLKDVSVKAESDISGLRKGELLKLKDSFDIHKADTDDDDALPPKIYPWPLYRKANLGGNKNNVLEEAWLGEDVTIPQNVPELVFVEELLEGLLTVARSDIDRDNRLNNPNIIEESWYPVNVLDTPLFGVIQNPYKTATIGDDSNKLNPLKLMGLRAFTFFGASNRNAKEQEIRLMAILEANSCYEGIVNPIIRESMLDISKEDEDLQVDIFNIWKDGGDTTRKITIEQSTDAARPIMYESGDKVFYKYLSGEGSDGGTGQKYIPFNGNFDGEEFYTDGLEPLSKATLKEKSYDVNTKSGTLFLGSKKDAYENESPSDSGAIFIKIFSVEEYESYKILVPQYVNQTESIKTLFGELKAADGAAYLDSGLLYSNEIEGPEAENTLSGWNIFGDETSNYAFTTVKNISITVGENGKTSNTGTGEGDLVYPVNPTDGASTPLTTVFYVSQLSRWGSTNLSKKSVNIPEFEQGGIFRGASGGAAGEIYLPLRHSASARKWSEATLASETPQLGENRELFNTTNTSLYVPYVDFAVRDGGIAYKEYCYSLFGSRWYFEQRQSFSPKTARALLFLHTLPWNQLYTDRIYDLGEGTDEATDNELAGEYGAIFENEEGHTIANLFNRKSAFLNVPYMWCAFIGGMLWRNIGSSATANPNESSDIIWEDDTPFENDGSGGDFSGQVPSYKGGSGDFDVLVWGDRKDPTEPLSDYNEGYPPEYSGDGEIDYEDFPRRNEFLTSWNANVPLGLNSNGKYKKISRTLLRLPSQAKREFIKIFFDFVNGSEWKTIRQTYEVQDAIWDRPNTTAVYNPNGYVDGNFSAGSNAWMIRWNEVSNIVDGDNYSITDSLYFEPVEGLSVLEATAALTVETALSVYNPDNLALAKFTGGISHIKKSEVEKFRNWENYAYLTPIRTQASDHRGLYDGASGDLDVDIKFNYDLGLKDTEANKIMVELFKRPVWLANANYKAWVQPSFVVEAYWGSLFDENHEGATAQLPFEHELFAQTENMKLYVQSFAGEWKRLNELNPDKVEEDNLKQQIFNTMDNDTIRLNIYRHCKALYDKWIAGSEGNIMTSCGTSKKTKDITNSRIDRKSGDPRLIDSFRFVNRAFNDLGDDYLLNPKIIDEIVTGNLNQSFYDLISRLLADNNFNFIALPAFIDFSSKKEMAALFKPEIFNEALDDEVAGPTFVCVYAGQTSNKLDLGKGSAFPNDGFDFKCDNGQLVVGEGGLPADFAKTGDTNEHNVVAFAVNYGQQNQNIFTDVKLDQQEFAETDESLQITDSIANQGGQSSRTQAGQNLWNVYQVRSYSTEITAMGNAMIQPMMYFQLNNIPMFHGAYMIINTSHNIIPNYMKTTFKGVRTRYIDTPLMDSDTLYMSMLGTLSDVDGAAAYAIGSGGSTSPNGSTNTKIAIEQGPFVTYEVKPNDAIEYQEHNPNAKGDSFAMEAVGKFMEALAKSWHTLHKDTAYSDKFYINSFGKYGGGGNKTHSDSSLHYGGRAVDFRPMLKTKEVVNWHVGQDNYSFKKNAELFQMAIDMSDANTYGVKVQNIILNDNNLLDAFSDVKNIGGGNVVIRATGHDNHIHMEFEIPDSVAKDIADGNIPEGITSNGVAGEITKESFSPLPTREQKLQSLGKI